MSRGQLALAVLALPLAALVASPARSLDPGARPPGAARGEAGESTAGELRAERIEEHTAGDLLIGGPDAIGGIGDWYLANERIEVIVDDPGRRHAKLDHGGTIVDAGLRDRRGEDQFARLFPLVNLSQRVFLNYDAMRAEVNEGEGWARLLVSSPGLSSLPRASGWRRALDLLVPDPEELARVSVETEYAVFRGEPFVHITTTFRNRGDTPAPLFSYGDVWMRGGRSGRSFVANTLEPTRSRGFHHASFDRRAILRAGDAMAGSTLVAVPGLPRRPPIGYALFAPERAARGLLQFGVTGKHVSLVNAFLADPGWRELGLLRIVGAIRGELAPGETWSFRRRLLITGRGDVASATDVIFPELGFADGHSGVAGRIEPRGLRASIQVESALGHPVTQIAPPIAGVGAGRYRALLPPGDYVLTVRAPQRASRRIEVTVEPDRFTAVPLQRFEEPGWLRFERPFRDGGPGRVVVEGVPPTPDPVFQPELLDFRLDGVTVASGMETRELHFVGNESDPRRVAIAPGRYRLTATRGFEFELDQVEVEVPGPGREVAVPSFQLTRALSLPGWVSADLHVHAQASDDSGMSNAARLRSFAADGVDVMVSTDHDHIGDFRPALEALALTDRIRVIQGVEVTSSAPSPAAPWTLGHHNAWPIPFQPLQHRKGAPPSQDLSLADLYSLLRRDYGAEVVQLNHPRVETPGGSDDEAFLTHLGDVGAAYDPTRRIDAGSNRRLLEAAADGTRAIDFDAIEVMNGKRQGRYRLVRDDWHSFLQQGYRRTAVANSDTHGPGSPAGYPRNYVRLQDAAANAARAGPEAWDATTFNEAIRAGRVMGTNGPLITEFRVNGAAVGEDVAAPRGKALVSIEVAAPSWVPVQEVRILVNGVVDRVYRDLPTPARGESPVRLAERAELTLDRDAFVTIEAGAPIESEIESWLAAHPGDYARVLAPGFIPAAFTNPVYVDADGNGRFDPPGLILGGRASGRSDSGLGVGVAVGVAVGLGGFWWWRRRQRIPDYLRGE